MDTYHVTLTGESPLLLHNDNLEWAEQMTRWGADPENQKLSVRGDDRSPAWRWLGYCYHDGKSVGIASDNIMTALREGGAKVPVPGKKSLTYKRQSQSGLVVNELLWPLVTSAGAVSWPKVSALAAETNYQAHEEAARALGFELFGKRATVGTSKHVRVRPRFNAWSAAGTITVFDESITRDVLVSILMMAGLYCGLGDWRPSAPKKPGPFGRFTSVVKVAK